VTLQKCILIVDDIQTIRTAVRKFLESQTGLAVCGEAVDGFDALEKARNLCPDLIILDLSMPRMNGLQTARELRAMSVPAPIILFTMYGDQLRPQDALAVGISAVVAKTDLSILQQQIDKLLVPGECC
jgi:DNA-binding NarL/FixJ family response regulator